MYFKWIKMDKYFIFLFFLIQILREKEFSKIMFRLCLFVLI